MLCSSPRHAQNFRGVPLKCRCFTCIARRRSSSLLTPAESASQPTGGSRENTDAIACKVNDVLDPKASSGRKKGSEGGARVGSALLSLFSVHEGRKGGRCILLDLSRAQTLLQFCIVDDDCRRHLQMWVAGKSIEGRCKPALCGFIWW